MKGRKNQFFRKGNSLEAISLEWESTVIRFQKKLKSHCAIAVSANFEPLLQ